MASSVFRTKPALLIGVGVVAAAFIIGLAIALSGSGDDSDPTAVEQEEPDPGPDYEIEPGPRFHPEPQPRPEPVSGDVESIDHVSVSIHDRDVYADGQPEAEVVPTDEDAVQAFTDAVAAWLDEHLDDLQHDGDGSVPEDAFAGDASIVALAGGDSEGDAFVERATYTFTVYVRGEPEWLDAFVEVERRDGSTRSAQLVFLPADEGGVTLVAGESATDEPNEPEDDSEGEQEEDA